MHRPHGAAAFLLVLALAVLLSGCATKHTVAPPATSQRTWIGTYETPSGPQAFVLDLVVTGSSVRGQVAMDPASAGLVRVAGTLEGDTLRLGRDPAANANATGFEATCHVAADGHLAGPYALSVGPSGSLDGHALQRVALATDLVVDLPFDVSGLATGGGFLWLATSGAYVRMTPSGTIADTIRVLDRPDLYWVSPQLTWDGSKMWGYLPGTIMVPNGHVDYSDLKAFTAAGRTADSIRVWHRTGGLAFDGLYLWSLRDDRPRVYKLGPTGAPLDSIALEAPDATRLAFDGTRFWTTGWNLVRLYVADYSGHTLGIADLPGTEGGEGWPAGVAIDGSTIWFALYARGHSTLYKLHVVGTLPV